jgi:hypothetical protein
MYAYKKLAPIYDEDGKFLTFQSPQLGNLWIPDNEGYPFLESENEPEIENGSGIHVVFNPDDPRLNDYCGLMVRVEIWGTIIKYESENDPFSARAQFARAVEVVNQGEINCAPIEEIMAKYARNIVETHMVKYLPDHVFDQLCEKYLELMLYNEFAVQRMNSEQLRKWSLLATHRAIGSREIMKKLDHNTRLKIASMYPDFTLNSDYISLFTDQELEDLALLAVKGRFLENPKLLHRFSRKTIEELAYRFPNRLELYNTFFDLVPADIIIDLAVKGGNEWLVNKFLWLFEGDKENVKEVLRMYEFTRPITQQDD